MTLEFQGQRGERVLWTGILKAWRVLMISLQFQRCGSFRWGRQESENTMWSDWLQLRTLYTVDCHWCKNSEALSAEAIGCQTRNIRGLKQKNRKLQKGKGGNQDFRIQKARRGRAFMNFWRRGGWKTVRAVFGWVWLFSGITQTPFNKQM